MVEQFIGQTLAHKYRIERQWRSDVYGTTFHAVQEAIDKPVTVKILNPDLAEFANVAANFQMEARILSRIANPHILNVLDFARDERGLTFLVLETAEGQTLKDFIQSAGGLTLERAGRIARQLADALTIAHSNDVVHGSLSSDKILVSERNGEEFVKIIDFGANTDAGFGDEPTVVRLEMPFYKAPEQLSGAEADARTDIYALGVILYQLLTGSAPFAANNAAEVAQKHLREIPPSLIAARPDLPPVLEQIVQRALAKQPEQRFQSARDFSDALENGVRTAGYSENAAYTAAAGYNGAPARPTPPIEPNSSAGNPYKTAFIVLAGIMVLSIVGIYVTGGFRNTPTTQMNVDPAAQPVQPVNPISSTGEDLSNTGYPNANTINGNIDPTVIPPGVTGVPQGIPPGLYPPGTTGGQIMTIPGNSNSIFMGDLNANAVPINTNTRSANANVRPTNTNTAANANVVTTPRTANANTGNANAAAKPTPATAPPAAATPKPAPAKPPADAPKPSATKAESQSALTKDN